MQASINGHRGSDADRNRVSILSQQLEDSFGGQPPPQLPNKPSKPTTTKPTLITTISVNTRENDAVSQQTFTKVIRILTWLCGM